MSRLQLLAPRVAAAVLAVVVPQVSAQAAITVLAAGSLRAALTEIAADFEAAPGGAPGLLRDRLQAGEAADVFASANMEHPQALAASGRAEPALPFARNALCALAAPSFGLNGQPLVQRLLDESVKLGISTPKADPSGDYAFALFDRIETRGAAPAGSAARLKAKALQLTGGPDSPAPPKDRNIYGALLAGGEADVFITYCTNAEIARREQPLQVLTLPDDLNVSATYGLSLLRPVSQAALRFVAHLRGAPRQRRLAAWGFAAP